MQQMYELTFEDSLGPVKRTLLGNVQGFSVTGIGAYVKPGSGRHVIMRGTSLHAYLWSLAYWWYLGWANFQYEPCHVKKTNK